MCPFILYINCLGMATLTLFYILYIMWKQIPTSNFLLCLELVKQFSEVVSIFGPNLQTKTLLLLRPKLNSRTFLMAQPVSFNILSQKHSSVYLENI